MRRTGFALGGAVLAFTGFTGFTGLALADDPALQPPPNPPPPATATANGDAHANVAVGASTNGNGAMTLPANNDPPPARVAPGDSEHDAVVGTLAIGYLGARSLVVGCNPPAEGTQAGVTCGGNRQALSAPVIGIRYWITDLIGIDAGLGMAINSLSDNRPSSTAFLIHGGVPLALASAGHFTFEVIPEMNLGFSTWSQNGNGSGSGFHFDIGARAGAEIHFGFIGLPKLSLLGTIGLQLTVDSSKGEPPGGANNNLSEVSFGTTVQDNPWNIFTSNVAALYYF